MKNIKTVFLLAFLLLCMLSTSVLAEIFDLPAFWNSALKDEKIQKAWKEGVKWQYSALAYAVYDNGIIYGFASTAIPPDKDATLRAKLAITYAARSKMRAVNAAGIFAFNSFECEALADYQTMEPNLNQCSEINIESAFSGEWENQAYSIVRIPAENICACRKALDKGIGENNSDTFYGRIAGNELMRLYEESSPSAVLDFFENNYRRKIFLAPELIIAADCFIKTSQIDKALVILDAVLEHFGKVLTSEQYEKCGDLYYSVGEKQKAAGSYAAAIISLHN